MRVAICDDEACFAETIHNYIWGIWDCDIDVFLNPVDLLSQYKKGIHYDVIFCDILMEPYNGIEVGQKIRNFDTNVILVYLTSNLEYAPLGYEVSAFRYLLKPIHRDSLQTVLEDILSLEKQKRKLIIETESGSLLVAPNSILFLEAQDKETVIICVNDKIIVRKSLGELENELNRFSFFRIHRKYLVNLNHIEEYDHSRITLDNGQNLPISRRKNKLFQSAMEAFISGN